jgi:hypothetical protein
MGRQAVEIDFFGAGMLATSRGAMRDDSLSDDNKETLRSNGWRLTQCIAETI